MQHNITINICNININIYNNVDINTIKTKEQEIKDKYDFLDRNIKTNTIDKNEAGRNINDIALNLKYLFEQNFKYYNPLNQSNYYLKDTLKSFLDVALKFLKQFKKYLDEDKINKEVFDIFKDEVLYMIDTSGNVRDKYSKVKLFEDLIKYEVLRMYNLQSRNHIQFGYQCQNYFHKDSLEKYHKENYIDILVVSHDKNFVFNLELYYTYFDSIIEFYKMILKI
ncbi:hypothetical protein [Aliarcobacter cryaerophilus]|uniref:hypothetical protein n=1 Tax=Aliarcobacter cryaerophilus TaxID=28198 RepID=UPI0021B5AAD3|nr:hypothetical protein [Aliarcobacter cryaerophilus]MCT7519004.1 hypothetical protein [Aliarcobacter cryaerophilus]